MKHPNRFTAVLAISLGVISLACKPENGGDPGDRESRRPGAGPVGNRSLECEIRRPPAPRANRGPTKDGPNFYQFTSVAEGEVSCTGNVAEIKVNVVFHWSTNGEHGAAVGRDTFCRDTRECESFTEYHRRRLYCEEVYHYRDYAQVTAWYKREAASVAVRISREGRANRESSYRPQRVCPQPK